MVPSGVGRNWKESFINTFIPASWKRTLAIWWTCDKGTVSQGYNTFRGSEKLEINAIP